MGTGHQTPTVPRGCRGAPPWPRPSSPRLRPDAATSQKHASCFSHGFRTAFFFRSPSWALRYMYTTTAVGPTRSSCRTTSSAQRQRLTTSFFVCIHTVIVIRTELIIVRYSFARPRVHSIRAPAAPPAGARAGARPRYRICWYGNGILLTSTSTPSNGSRGRRRARVDPRGRGRVAASHTTVCGRHALRWRDDRAVGVPHQRRPRQRPRKAASGRGAII